MVAQRGIDLRTAPRTTELAPRFQQFTKLQKAELQLVAEANSWIDLRVDSARHKLFPLANGVAVEMPFQDSLSLRLETVEVGEMQFRYTLTFPAKTTDSTSQEVTVSGFEVVRAAKQAAGVRVIRAESNAVGIAFFRLTYPAPAAPAPTAKDSVAPVATAAPAAPQQAVPADAITVQLTVKGVIGWNVKSISRATVDGQPGVVTVLESNGVERRGRSVPSYDASGHLVVILYDENGRKRPFWLQSKEPIKVGMMAIPMEYHGTGATGSQTFYLSSPVPAAAPTTQPAGQPAGQQSGGGLGTPARTGNDG